MNRLKKYIGILIGVVFSFVLLPSCNTNNESAHIEEERNSIAVFLYSRDSVHAHYVV